MSLLLWILAVFCTLGGAFSVRHLQTLKKGSMITEGKVFERAGLDPPSYIYVFRVDDQKFTGSGRGPNQPLYEVGDTMPIAYFRTNPSLNNPGRSLRSPPLETPQGWFVIAAIAAFRALYIGVRAKFALKEYPWS